MSEREKEYNDLINVIAKQKELWLLEAEDGSFAMFEDKNNISYIAVWTGKDIANSQASDDWEGYVPERMGIFEFTDWMPELKTDEIRIGLFGNINSEPFALDPLDIKQTLIAATRIHSSKQ